MESFSFATGFSTDCRKTQINRDYMLFLIEPRVKVKGEGYRAVSLYSGVEVKRAVAKP